jgi:hypothetical protein
MHTTGWDSCSFPSSDSDLSSSMSQSTSDGVEHRGCDLDEDMVSLASIGDGGWYTDDEMDADDEDSEDDWIGEEMIEDEDGVGIDETDHKSRMGHWVKKEIKVMYASCYEVLQTRQAQGPPYVHHVLMVQKHKQPDQFRQSVRVSPRTFDKIVEHISDDPIFSNDSPNAQISVEVQLAITLYRFGHDGNAVSQQMVANWGGVTSFLCNKNLFL